MTTPQLTEPTTTTGASPTRARRLVAVPALAAAAAVAVVINVLIARLARSLGASTAFSPLDVPTFVPATVAGVLVGTAGWLTVRRIARRPARALAVVVPAAVLLSFIPDVLVLITRALPGTTPGAVAALMTMHLVITAVTVPTLARVLPAGAGRASTRLR